MKEKVKIKKDKAIVNGKAIPISTKDAIYICSFIKGKSILQAVGLMGGVIKKKTFVPMKGEIPHRTGGVIGRYPVKAAGHFIKLLKSLNANSDMNGIDNPYIAEAIANRAHEPSRRGGSTKFKRAHVTLVAREMKENIKEGKK